MNPQIPYSLFFSPFENEAVTHKLQPFPQYPLSIAFTFCQGLTFVSDFFPPLVRPLYKYSNYFCAPGKQPMTPKNSSCAQKTFHALENHAVRPKNSPCPRKSGSAPKKQPIPPKIRQCAQKNNPCLRKSGSAPRKQPMPPKIRQCAQK